MDNLRSSTPLVDGGFQTAWISRRQDSDGFVASFTAALHTSLNRPVNWGMLVLRGSLPRIWCSAFGFDDLISRARTGRLIHFLNHCRKFILRIAFSFRRVLWHGKRIKSKRRHPLRDHIIATTT